MVQLKAIDKPLSSSTAYLHSVISISFFNILYKKCWQFVLTSMSMDLCLWQATKLWVGENPRPAPPPTHLLGKRLPVLTPNSQPSSMSLHWQQPWRCGEFIWPLKIVHGEDLHGATVWLTVAFIRIYTVLVCVQPQESLLDSLIIGRDRNTLSAGYLWLGPMILECKPPDPLSQRSHLCL